MFQALFMQERDGRRDLIAHQRKDDTQTKKVATPPPMPRSPKIGRRACPQEEVKVKRHPTRANLIGGKVRFLSFGNNVMRTSLRRISYLCIIFRFNYYRDYSSICTIAMKSSDYYYFSLARPLKDWHDNTLYMIGYINPIFCLAIMNTWQRIDT